MHRVDCANAGELAWSLQRKHELDWWCPVQRENIEAGKTKEEREQMRPFQTCGNKLQRTKREIWGSRRAPSLPNSSRGFFGVVPVSQDRTGERSTEVPFDFLWRPVNQRGLVRSSCLYIEFYMGVRLRIQISCDS